MCLYFPEGVGEGVDVFVGCDGHPAEVDIGYIQDACSFMSVIKSWVQFMYLKQFWSWETAPSGQTVTG